MKVLPSYQVLACPNELSPLVWTMDTGGHNKDRAVRVTP